MNEFKNVAELQNETVELIQKDMRQNLRENRSMATGTLARSIETFNTKDKKGVLETALEIGAWYADLVDKGIDPRGSGRQPPIEPIEQWIKRKSISVPAGLTIKQFSFAIAKKVAKKGQRKRAYPFIQPAINVGEAFFDKNIDTALGNDAEINLEMILDSSPYLKPVR